MIELMFRELNTLAGLCFLLAFAARYITAWWKNTQTSMEAAIVAGLSAMLLPSGVAIFICAFTSSYIHLLGDQMLAFMVSGLAIIIISIKHGWPRL